MAPKTTRQAKAAEWTELGIGAARSGDHAAAVNFFTEACRIDPRNAARQFNLAVALEQTGEVDRAAAALATALRIDPALEEAARRLSGLARRYRIEAVAGLDAFGLGAALGARMADLDPIARLAIARQRQATDLGGAIEVACDGRPAEVAAEILSTRTPAFLADDLLLAALEAGINREPDLEVLLTGLRHALLTAIPNARFEDRALLRLLLALVRQCRLNGHVWPVSPAEQTALAALAPDPARIVAGDVGEAIALLRALLYREPRDVLGRDLRPDETAGIRPKAVRELLAALAAESAAEAEARARLPRLTPIEDAVSLRMKGQYEAAPYPRWTSITRPPPGGIHRALARIAGPERTAFFDRPFDVLIAGCGTGRQAIQSAIGYGPNARILAIDLSEASLAYARREADRLAIANLEFAVADILKLDTLGRRFDVVESLGVLHHMAEPWTGFRALLGALAPGGLVYVGLYSAIARAPLAELRNAPDYPGVDCSDDEARRYRAALLAREWQTPGLGFLGSQDFYTLGDFRDLVLNRNEHQVTIAEIAGFLAAERLDFLGFTLEPAIATAFAARFPDEPHPGSLDTWRIFEEESPRAFDAMYRFWCAAR
ncbi:MAG: class I SAM-dependent methyltransferase [Hyphomicrobiaceae bacterium]